MGNKISSNTVKPEEIKETHECIICFEGFPDPHELHVQCFICKKYTHRQCFHKYLESAGLTYCKCAYCRQVGTTMTNYVDTTVSAANGAFWR